MLFYETVLDRVHIEICKKFLRSINKGGEGRVDVRNFKSNLVASISFNAVFFLGLVFCYYTRFVLLNMVSCIVSFYFSIGSPGAIFVRYGICILFQGAPGVAGEV